MSFTPCLSHRVFTNSAKPVDNFEYWKCSVFHYGIQDPDVEGLIKKIVENGEKERMPIREYYFSYWQTLLKTRKEHDVMNSSKDTSSKQGTSSTSNNVSNKNVTHTQNLPPKTRSNSVSNNATDDYKYIPGADRLQSDTASDKRPSSGNIKGV